MREDGENVALSNHVGWFVHACALSKVILKKYVKNNFADEMMISIAGNKKRQQGVRNWRDMMMFSSKFFFFCCKEKEEEHLVVELWMHVLLLVKKKKFSLKKK